jgi:hypothetical protein
MAKRKSKTARPKGKAAKPKQPVKPKAARKRLEITDVLEFLARTAIKPAKPARVRKRKPRQKPKQQNQEPILSPLLEYLRADTKRLQNEIRMLLREDWKPPKIYHQPVVRVPPEPAMCDAMNEIADRMRNLGNQTVH